jgi:hypothetical protein
MPTPTGRFLQRVPTEGIPRAWEALGEDFFDWTRERCLQVGNRFLEPVAVVFEHSQPHIAGVAKDSPNYFGNMAMIHMALLSNTEHVKANLATVPLFIEHVVKLLR